MTFQSSSAGDANSNQITILQNADGHLLAEQRPGSGSSIAVTLILLIVGFAGMFAIKRQWKMLLFPAVASLVLIPLLSPANNPIYRIEVDQHGQAIIFDQLVKGKVVGHTVIPVNTIASAEMQFDRGKRTIVLIDRSGQQIFPLGKERLQNEPDQYVILNALRAAIGQMPAPPQ